MTTSEALDKFDTNKQRVDFIPVGDSYEVRGRWCMKSGSGSMVVEEDRLLGRLSRFEGTKLWFFEPVMQDIWKKIPERNVFGKKTLELIANEICRLDNIENGSI